MSDSQSSPPSKRTPSKKAAAKKSTAKKTAVKKSPTRKPAAKVTAAKASKAERPKQRIAKSAPTSEFFKRARERAAQIIDSPEKLKKLAAETDRASSSRSGPLGEVIDDLKAMIRLVVAYSRGNYRKIPAETLILVVAALTYVVMPVDLIPDFIPVIGFADDVAVVGWVLKQVRDELHAFKAWESGQEPDAQT